jgi:hypothetical protein
VSITIKKGQIGVEDTNYYSAASPTFSRLDSSGNATTRTAVGATHIPILNATGYFQANTVERGLQDIITRYVSPEHSIATFGAGAGVGSHNEVYGFKNALAATSIQAAASNHYLTDGVARIIIPDGTYTQATPLQLPRKTFIFGNGRGTVFRASSTVQTSRVFSVSGQVAATNSSLHAGANATINTNTVAVVDGTKFAADDWIIVRDSKDVEMQQVDSVSGNDLTVRGKLRHTYRTAATISHASLVYPAEVTMDNMDIQLTSATQGYGIAGTWMIQSQFGRDLKIKGFANAGVYLQNSETCQIDCTMEDASSATAGTGYGVHLSNSSDNIVSGVRRGISKDFAEAGSIRNFVWGANYRTGYPPSGIADPVAFWYRGRKPELSYATDAATTVVTCPASTSEPAEVYIGGHIFRNTGTAVCNLQLPASPSGNAWGMTGATPVTATLAHYIYAVPKPDPSATKQFEMICSATSPATGPSVLWPSWSWLGAVSTGASVRVQPFSQSGDKFIWNDVLQIVHRRGGQAGMAARQDVTSALIPTTARQIFVSVSAATALVAETRGVFSSRISRGGETNVTIGEFNFDISGFRGNATILTTTRETQDGWVSLDSSRQIAYVASNAATFGWEVRMGGFDIDRGLYR